MLATFKSFLEDKGLKLSASLAYYTIFAIGPLFMLIIALTSLFYKSSGRDVKSEMFQQMSSFIGPQAATQIEQILKNISISGETNFALVISIITVVIGATSIFIEIQDSLNMIWKLKAKPKKGWLAFLKNRLLSSSLIISLGFLLVVSLVVNGLIQALMGIIARKFSELAQIMVVGINFIITFLVITTLFAIIFKFLPDARIKWKDVRSGAVFTALLFMLGRYLISLYIENSATESTYGAAGSIIILLLWVYYSSVILYMGAEFTHIYTEAFGGHIQPAEYAVYVHQIEEEKEVAVLPKKHNVE